VVVVLPETFLEMGVWRNFAEIQQSGYIPKSRSGPEVKDQK